MSHNVMNRPEYVSLPLCLYCLNKGNKIFVKLPQSLYMCRKVDTKQVVIILVTWKSWPQMFHCTNRSLSWTLTFALWGIHSHSFLPDEILDMLHCEVGQIRIKIKCQVAVGLITRIMKSRKVRMCQSLLSCDPSSWVELQHLLSQVTSNSGCLWEPRSQRFSLLT